MKLTVVIYAQNTASELVEKSLKAVYGSTLNDYEVLLLDDGSANAYTELAEKYGARYVRTEKRGAFASRLYSVEIANGEYIAFANAGNTATFNYYMPMLDKATEAGADIVINDIAYEVNGVKLISGAEVAKDYDLCGKEILDELVHDHARTYAYYSLYNKIFKKSVLKKMKRELEKTDAIMLSLSCKEDILLSIYAFKNASKLVSVHTGYYILGVDTDKRDVEALATSVTALFDYGVGYLNVGLVKDTFLGALLLVAKAQKEKTKSLLESDAVCCERVKPLSKKEAVMYAKMQALGDNFDDIERALKKVYSSGAGATVIYDMSDEYVKSTLEAVQSTRSAQQKQVTLMVPKKITKKKAKIAPSELLAYVSL